MKRKHYNSSDLKKRIMYCSLSVAIIAGVMHLYNGSNKSEETIEIEENMADLNSLTKINIFDPYVFDYSISIEDNTEMNEKTSNPIVEEETEEDIVIDINSLYYVEEDGYKSYLHEDYQDFLYLMCIKYDVKEYYELFIAQMYHESSFRTNLVSGTNDYGIMQINTCNHEWLRDKFGFTDFLDPYVSIMSLYLHKYNDVEKALVCYNMGESAVRKRGIYSSTYSRGVLNDIDLLVKID